MTYDYDLGELAIVAALLTTGTIGLGLLLYAWTLPTLVALALFGVFFALLKWRLG